MSAHPEPGPLLSVVLCTRNRCQDLPRSLEHMGAVQASAPWELIIVDNGSTDGTWQVLTEFRASTRLGVALVQEPRPGISRGRNAGWRRARGGVVCFTDDDCYLQPNFIDAMVAVFAEGKLGFAGGRVLLFDPADAPITIQPRDSRLDIPPGSYIPPGIIHGANFAFRRALLEIIGGFDERLGTGTAIPSGEDVDMLSRASAAGYAGAYDPRPTVLHHHGRRSTDQIERLRRGYELGRGAYHFKCLLDRRRRRAAVRPILRKLKGSLLASLRKPKEMLPHFRELEGAVRYVLSGVRSPRS